MTENPPSTLSNGPVLNQRLGHHTHAILDMSASWVPRCSFLFLFFVSSLAFLFVLIVAVQLLSLFFVRIFCFEV